MKKNVTAANCFFFNHSRNNLVCHQRESEPLYRNISGLRAMSRKRLAAAMPKQWRHIKYRPFFIVEANGGNRLLSLAGYYRNERNIALTRVARRKRLVAAVCRIKSAAYRGCVRLCAWHLHGVTGSLVRTRWLQTYRNASCGISLTGAGWLAWRCRGNALYIAYHRWRGWRGVLSRRQAWLCKTAGEEINKRVYHRNDGICARLSRRRTGL